MSVFSDPQPLSTHRTDPVPAALRGWLSQMDASQSQLADELALLTTGSWSQARVSRILGGTLSLGWAERFEVAQALGLPPQSLGVTVAVSPPPDPRNARGYASNLAEAAEQLRAAGQSRGAAAVVVDELDRTGWAEKVPTLQREREAQIELLLALGAARSDFTPAAALDTVTIPLFTRARGLAKQLPTPAPHLSWKASMRLGNELRKVGKHRPAAMYLEQAYRSAPTRAERHQTLIPHARGLLAIRETDQAAVMLREIQEAALDPEHHSVSLHPLSALDFELRLTLVTNGVRRRTEELRQRLGGESRTPLAAPPQWHITWGVSQFADALFEGDLERSSELRDVVRDTAASLGLPPTMKRLATIDRVLVAAAGRRGDKALRQGQAIELIAPAASA